jgi:hypothetical protein
MYGRFGSFTDKGRMDGHLVCLKSSNTTIAGKIGWKLNTIKTNIMKFVAEKRVPLQSMEDDIYGDFKVGAATSKSAGPPPIHRTVASDAGTAPLADEMGCVVVFCFVLCGRFAHAAYG